MKTYEVPQLAWFGPKTFPIVLPDYWKVKVCQMQGAQRKGITREDIRAALESPAGTAPLKVLSRGKKEVAIVFDDLTRITRVAPIAEEIIEELNKAGVSQENIRFICGLGMHGVMNRSDFVKKLGEKIVSNFRVYNHNPFGNCEYVGTTNTFGTKVFINEEYLKCDLKIVIGSCVPHPVAGFGGGGKLVMPGLASFETVSWHHKIGGARMDPLDICSKPPQGMGLIENNLFQRDIDEAAKITGIDFLINVTVNLWGDTVAIYTGDLSQVFSAVVRDARFNYRTEKTSPGDIVIANSYAKASESMISLAAAIPLVKKSGGDVVIIANAPEGQVVHYLVGIFGKTTYACQYSQCKIPEYIDRVIIFNEYPHRGSSWFEDHPKIIYRNKWESVLALLKDKHGPGTEVILIPDATIQYFDWYG